MSRVREGEVEKLEILYQRHRAPLLNFFVRMSGDVSASEDLVHEVFLRMLKYRHTFSPEKRFTSWMYQVGRNAFYDTRRKRRPEIALQEGEGEIEEQYACPRPGPDSDLERKQQIGLLNRALGELPVELREVLALSRFHDLKYEEIAEILNCGVGAVKMRMHRALKELRNRFFKISKEGVL